MQAVGATLIEDGAITTDKILANAITAGKIAALAIEADHISANAITADKIHAGAIDCKLITGARIRTSASGRSCGVGLGGAESVRLVVLYGAEYGDVGWVDRMWGTVADSLVIEIERGW